MWLGYQGGCGGHVLIASAVQWEHDSFPDSGEWIMLRSVAGGVWCAEEAMRVRSMGALISAQLRVLLEWQMVNIRSGIQA